MTRADTSLPRTVMYLAYGADRHIQETLLSLLTAFRLSPPGPGGLHYVVYTDRRDLFEACPIEIVELTSATLDQWMSGGSYIHRRKTMAILDALERFGGQVVFIDSDTFFRRAPEHLFRRISDRDACLHVMEGRLDSGEWHSNKLLASYDGRPLGAEHGTSFRVQPSCRMWNTGVIGLGPAQLDTYRRVPALIDELWAMSHVNVVEQYVTGQLLEENFYVHPCMDVVFHYWMEYLKKDFHMRLDEIMLRLRNKSLDEQIALAWACRPKPTLSMRLKYYVREAPRAIGIRVGDISRSA